MLKSFLLFSFSLLFFANSFAGPRVEYKIHKNGDAFVGLKKGQTISTVNPNLLPVANLFQGSFSYQYDGSFVTLTTFTPTGGTTIYDLESNGVPMQIWQDPNTPDNIHCVLTSSPPGDPGFTVRQTKYYFSSDRGVTWAFVADVPSPTPRSGFCAISGLSDGNALVTNHSNAGGGTTRAQVFVDAFPGLGSFTALDPGLIGSAAPIWPRVVATSSITNTNKFVMVASYNGVDSTFSNVGTSLSASTFLGYQYVPADQAETYSLARGSDGRIGLAFKNNDVNNPSTYGDAYFMESTDGGATWGPVSHLFHADFSGDSLGLIRGITVVYQGNTPKVTFETIKQTTAGNFFPGAPSNIRFWSPTLPGADPNRSIIIADSNNVPFAPYLGVNDVMAPICRPSIGVSADGNALMVAFTVASSETGGLDTTSFKDVYLTASNDGGATWETPVRLNPTSPRRDWSYPSVSQWNDNAGSSYFANISVFSDSVPGSYVNGAGNGESLAQQIFLRASFDFVGVNNISSQVPDRFTLHQNYPNPFNPSTSIRFALPSKANVTLKIYDITGKVVATLINNEVVTAGLNEVNFDASNLASGLYFYSLQAGDFRETKKMVLMK